MNYRRGVRLFLAGRSGDLYAPFGYGRAPVRDAWSRAVCLVDPTVQHLGLSAWISDPAPHTPPGERCMCGWRVYPDMAAAVDGARHMPSRISTLLASRDDLVLAHVVYAGVVRERGTVNLPKLDAAFAKLLRARLGRTEMVLDRNDRDEWTVMVQDDRQTVRAEAIWVTGPLVVGSRVPAAIRRALVNRYGAPQIRTAEPSVHTALTAGELVDAEAAC